MKCPRCGNTQKSYFYKGSHGYYCRKCIGFGRLLLEEEINSKLEDIHDDCSEYTMQYPLTNSKKQYPKSANNTFVQKMYCWSVFVVLANGNGA